MQNQDNYWIKKIQKGDSQAFAEIYSQYVNKIYNFIFFKTFHKETAEDLTSQVFLKVLEKINTFKKEGSFSAWIFTIARNTVIDYCRQQKKDVSIDSLHNLSDNLDISKDFLNKSLIEKIKEHLEKFDDIQKEIIIMRIWQDMPYKEIAEIVGKSEANCKMIFLRSINKIRSSLSEIMLLLLLFSFLDRYK